MSQIKFMRFAGSNEAGNPRHGRDAKAAQAIAEAEAEGWVLVSVSEMWPNDDFRLLVTLRKAEILQPKTAAETIHQVAAWLGVQASKEERTKFLTWIYGAVAGPGPCTCSNPEIGFVTGRCLACGKLVPRTVEHRKCKHCEHSESHPIHDFAPGDGSHRFELASEVLPQKG